MIRVIGSSTRVFVPAESGSQQKVHNDAGATVYYGSSTVTTSSYTGSLAVGSSVILSQGVWFISPTSTQIDIQAHAVPQSAWRGYWASLTGEQLTSGDLIAHLDSPGVTSLWIATTDFIVSAVWATDQASLAAAAAPNSV